MPSDRFYAELADLFYLKLAELESRGDPTCLHEYRLMGLYQMSQSALQDVGYMNAHGGWTGKHGIWSRDDFLNQLDIQTLAIRVYHNIVWTRYLPDIVRNNVGSIIRGVRLTESGLIAGAHLVGHDGLVRYIRSGGIEDTCDEIGIPCSEYVRQFGRI